MPSTDDITTETGVCAVVYSVLKSVIKNRTMRQKAVSFPEGFDPDSTWYDMIRKVEKDADWTFTDYAPNFFINIEIADRVGGKAVIVMIDYKFEVGSLQAYWKKRATGTDSDSE
jgi:hypothetical protein